MKIAQEKKKNKKHPLKVAKLMMKPKKNPQKWKDLYNKSLQIHFKVNMVNFLYICYKFNLIHYFFVYLLNTDVTWASYNIAKEEI